MLTNMEHKSQANVGVCGAAFEYTQLMDRT